MDAVTLGLILTGASALLPFIAQAIGGGAREIKPRYPWETPIGQQVLDILRQPAQFYPGQLTLPLTPQEIALAEALSRPLALDLEPARSYMIRALAGEYLRPETQPYLQALTGAINTARERTLRQAIDEIGGAVQRAGVPKGSAEANLRQRAAESIMQQTAGQLAQLYGGIYEAERQRQQQLLPIYLQYALAPSQQALAGLQAQQYLRQAMLQNILLPYQEWQRYRQEQLLPLQTYMQMLQLPVTYPTYRPPDWLYYVSPLSETLATAGGYLMYPRLTTQNRAIGG